MAETETDVPPPGEDRRAWIRHELQRRVNDDTGRRWTQADVAREAYVNESTVSLVYLGERKTGAGTEKVMRITARILDTTTDRLFGVALDAGDGYPGSPTPAVSESTAPPVADD